MRIRNLEILLILSIVLSVFLLAGGCSSDSTSGDGDEEECPAGQVLGPDGKCHDPVINDGDDETLPDGDKDDDAPDGDHEIDGDQTDGDGDPDKDPEIDGDTDGDTPDGDTPDGDTPDGDTPDGDTPDGDKDPDAETDGDSEDGDETDGESCFNQGCTIDEDCCYGHYCIGGHCGYDCTPATEFLCSNPTGCCDAATGRCVVCGGDPDEEEAEGPQICDVNGIGGYQFDFLCPTGEICESGTGWCVEGCPNGQSCSASQICPGGDHPRCVPKCNVSGNTGGELYDNNCEIGLICGDTENYCIEGCSASNPCDANFTCENDDHPRCVANRRGLDGGVK